MSRILLSALRALTCAAGALFIVATTSAQAPWIEVPASPIASFETTLDTARSRVLAIDRVGQTWIWSGASWSRIDTNGPVSTSGNLAIDYDSGRDRVVWYDGDSRQTWEYDGMTWTSIPAPTTPSARSQFDLAYDASRERTVLHGGSTGGGGLLDPNLSDTWEWDGSTWTLVSSSGPASSGHTMEFDAVSGTTFLFGVRPSFLSGSLPETWTWDGSAWTQLVAPGPQIGNGFLAFDTVQNRLTLYTGFILIPGGQPTIWNWDGSAWVLAGSFMGPDAPVFLDDLTFDSNRNVLVGFESRRIWDWDGSTWTLRPPFPSPLDDLSVAFDSARGRAVVITAADDDVTWELDGVRWIPRDTPIRPRLLGYEIDYDTQRGVSVLFGGRNEQAGVFASAETWEWDGSQWTLADLGTGPTQRFDHAATYDHARGELVMHGGYFINSQLVPDGTWTWDGTSWTLKSTAQSPGARAGHAMAYDSRRGRTVLFGGFTANGVFIGNLDNEVWEWDGVNWSMIPTTVRPSPRHSHQLAYDEARGRIVLQGGRGSFTLEDTWEWDGQTWREVQSVGPRSRMPSMTYSTKSDRVLLLRDPDTGSGGAPVLQLETSQVGAGCLTAGSPRIQVADDRPMPGETVEVRLQSIPSSGLAFHLLGFEPATPSIDLGVLGLPCELLIADANVVSTQSLDFLAQNGEVTWDFPIPDVLAAVGVRVLVQSVVQGPAPTDVTLSDARVFVVDAPPATPPTIASISPSSAFAGETITVTGSGYSFGTVVTIDGASVAPLNVQFDAITFAYPSSVACDATLELTNPDGSTASAPFNPTPTVTSTPSNSGSAAGGGTLIILGSGFVAGTTVTVGGAAAMLTNVTATVVIATAPPGAVGPAEVVITTPGGCVATATYNYL